ncbi:MAG: triose-phosphate isomerase [Thermoplasmata archaeon]
MHTLPVVVINFKSYEQIYGEKGLNIAKYAEKASLENDISIYVAPPVIDIYQYAKALSIPVIAQHVDSAEPSRNTGFITVEMLGSAGAHGSLLNHSEHPISLHDIAISINKLKSMNLKSIVCAPTSEEASAIAMLSPDFIAIEPPELIAGNVSVSKARPELISDTVEKVRKVMPKMPILCGAGIKDGSDVKKAVDLETDGILVASGVVISKDPKRSLDELLKAF